MNNPDHIYYISWKPFFWVKILKFDADPGWKNSDPGSRINIPDPQHCRQMIRILSGRPEKPD
jgi:hypothetical protein